MAISRLGSQAALLERFARDVWAPARDVLAYQLDYELMMQRKQRGDAAGDMRVQRLQRLLREGLRVEPLTHRNVGEATELVAAQFGAHDPLTKAAGIAPQDMLKVTRLWIARRLRNVDPLSLVAYVGNELAAVLTAWDPQEDWDEHAASVVAATNASTKFAVLAAVNERLDNAARAIGALDVHSTLERRVDMSIGATEDCVRVPLYGNAPMDAASAPPRLPPYMGDSLTQAVFWAVMEGMATCGVYTHVGGQCHPRSMRAMGSFSMRAQWWRQQTGAPSRSRDWDVLLRIPFEELGLANRPDVMHACLTQIRPKKIADWEQ